MYHNLYGVRVFAMVHVAHVLVLIATAASAINNEGYPNNIRGPIRGWRSWNAVNDDVTQNFISAQVLAISARKMNVNGKPTSLLELGYNRIGIDSGWASCTGVNGSWHDDTGHFIVNKTKFPDMKAMVEDAHSHGVMMGFYLNQDMDPAWHQCKSEGEITGAAANTGNYASYKNDIEDMIALGFDGVKFDAGGGNDDMNRWAKQLNQSGRPVMIENCNNGGYVPYPLKDARGHKMPNLPPVGEDCPFNMFRTGIDNAPSPLSMVSNLMDTSRYLNVSRPGCWAYPDMLELGTPVVGQHASRPDPTHPNGRHSMCNKSDGTVGDTGPRLSLEQGKAEFAAWCSVSSPLILGFDIGNETEYNRWFPVIANQLALRIQASWAGLAGKLVQASSQTFKTVVPHGCTCEDMKDTRDLPTYSVWGKPVSETSWGITAINSVHNQTQEIRVMLADLHGLKRRIKVTDVWTGATKTVADTDVWTATLAPAGQPGGHTFVLIEAV